MTRQAKTKAAPEAGRASAVQPDAPAHRHRLDGLEPDNLLAFLALIGLLRALDETDVGKPAADRVVARAAFDIARPPLRPVLVLARAATRSEVCELAADGIDRLAEDHAFGAWRDPTLPGDTARRLLRDAAFGGPAGRRRADLLAALMSDGAIKRDKGAKSDPVDPTPLCLMFGQGHQHFLERLAAVPRIPAPPPRGRGKTAVTLTAAQTLCEALFEPWRRDDPTFAFRWDPQEDVRYAQMAGDPTDPAYKGGTQHGANRLAAVGLALFTVVPQTRGDRARAVIPGSPDGRTLRWPIWTDPARLSAIRALLAHPGLLVPDGLGHLGVDRVLELRRVSNGKFMNVTRAAAR